MVRPCWRSLRSPSVCEAMTGFFLGRPDLGGRRGEGHKSSQARLIGCVLPESCRALGEGGQWGHAGMIGCGNEE